MTNTNRQNEPKLRFPGFDVAWKEKTLGDFFTFKNGVNADKSSYGRGRKFINVLDIISDTPITYDSIIGSVEISDKEFEKNEVRYGDILFQRSSETREEVGQSNVYLDPEHSATFGGFVIRGRPVTEIEPEYFHNLLKTARVRKDMTARSGGSTRYNVGQESLSAVSITIAPTLNEQRKIADFVGVVEAKIAQLERKKALVEGYKKGCMQQLFSRSVRFKDEDGNDFPDWAEKRLGDIGKTFGGLTGKSAADFGSGARFVTYLQVFKASQIYPEQCGFVEVSADERQNTIRRGDIIFTTSSETPKEVGFASVVTLEMPDTYLNSFCFGLRPNNINALLPEFSRYLFRSEGYRTKVIPLAQGSTRYNLSKASFLKIKLHIPHPDEQRKIADFLSTLDRKLDQVEQELELAQTFKKGLLQQMFV